MKKLIQHYLHPLHLWALFGGRFKRVFRLYELILWQCVIRPLVN